jgi:ubiquinone/menaquinone biosynthesis C-methylase UbiE
MSRPHYSSDDIRRTYEKIHVHRFTREIIARYSTNKGDIREVALNGLDLSNTSKVLDLGCGYGLFVERLKDRLPPDAYITGMDMVESNRQAFLRTLESINCAGKFIKGGADMIHDLQDESFDLIIASYSLYFFPYLIGEIARILKDNGIFIAITHSKFSLREITDLIHLSMKKIGLEPPDKIAIAELFHAFSLEDGMSLLTPFFTQVDILLYPNTMLFPLENINDCINYLTIKSHLLFKDIAERRPERIDDVQSHFFQSVHRLAHEQGGFTITKDDAIFRCYTPLRNHAHGQTHAVGRSKA